MDESIFLKRPFPTMESMRKAREKLNFKAKEYFRS